MHHSRLCTVIIDCETEDVATAATFWSKALGRAVIAPAAESPYRALATPPGEIPCQVQAVTHTSRVHLDIETDDLDAEVQRLTALGAMEAERHATWVVMQAPTGQRFCVGRVKTRGFPAGANRWD